MLDRVSVQYSYRSTFTAAGREIPLAALKRMTELTNGYAYAFQLLGYLIWNTGQSTVTDDVIDSVMDSYKQSLFRNAYSKIYDELSAVDQKFLLVMAKSGKDDVPMKEIVSGMNRKNNYISTYRRRLMDSGVITASTYGYVRFTLPLFRDYLMEFRL